MQREKPKSEDLFLIDEMADECPREASAGRAAAAFLERARIAGVARIAEVHLSGRRESRAGARRPGRKDAVEHVDPGSDHAENALRVAESHEVTRLVGRQERLRPSHRLEDLLAALSDRQASERVSVEAER